MYDLTCDKYESEVFVQKYTHYTNVIQRLIRIFFLTQIDVPVSSQQIASQAPTQVVFALNLLQNGHRNPEKSTKLAAVSRSISFRSK